MSDANRALGARVLAAVLLAAVVALASTAPVAAHDRDMGGPWCGPVTANTPYESNGIIGGQGSIFCNGLTPPVPMSVSFCLQWWDELLGAWQTDEPSCDNWGGTARQYDTWVIRACMVGTWRLIAWAQWWLDGHWHYTSDESAPQWIGCTT
jgi:hypothetical protein